MTQEQQAALSKILLTPEGRKEVASRMVIPMRCGGCSYDDQGRRMYMHGGKWLLEEGEEYRALRRKCGWD